MKTHKIQKWNVWILDQILYGGRENAAEDIIGTTDKIGMWTVGCIKVFHLPLFPKFDYNIVVMWEIPFFLGNTPLSIKD